MSTMEVLGAGYRAAKAAARQQRAERRSHARTRTRSASRVLTFIADHGLSIAALGCITAAALMIAVPLGLVVAGASLFALEMKVTA